MDWNLLHVVFDVSITIALFLLAGHNDAVAADLTALREDVAALFPPADAEAPR